MAAESAGKQGQRTDETQDGGTLKDVFRVRIAGSISVLMLVGVVVLALGGTALGLTGVLTNRDAVYPTPSISGTITDADGAAITTENVCVQASTRVGGGVVATRKLNKLGEYDLSGLTQDDYYVHAYDCASDKFRNDVATYYTGSGTDPVAVTVTDGDALTGINIQLATATTISGVVHGGNASTPVAGACVTATPTEGDGLYSDHSAVTASNGSYTLTRIVPRCFIPDHLRPRPAAAKTAVRTWPSTGTAPSLQADATPVSATVAEPATGVDPLLAVGDKITGTISEPSGASVGPGG